MADDEERERPLDTREADRDRRWRLLDDALEEFAVEYGPADEEQVQKYINLLR